MRFFISFYEVMHLYWA